MKKYKSPEYLAKVGYRLEIYIEYLGMAKSEFAKGADFKDSQVSNWLSGKQRVGLDAALTMSALYGLNIRYMYEGNTDTLDINFRKFLLSKPADKWAN